MAAEAAGADNWDLGLDPTSFLTFTWQNEKDVPKAALKATNASGYYIAYKVKTTKPKRYVVRPPQGIVLAEQGAEIMLSMVPSDANALWNEASERARLNAGDLPCDDKFLVQMALVSEEYYNTQLKDLDEKAQGTTLQKLWKNLSDEDKKREKEGKPKQIKSRKLTTKFEFPDIPVYTALKHLEIPEDPVKDDSYSEKTGDSQAFTELQSLRKKYDDLVAYTVVLTGERDFLLSETEDRKGQLKRAEEDLQKARGKSGQAAAAAAVAAGTPGIVAETPKGDPKGLNLVHVIVAALVAFIFGRIIS